MAEFCLKCWNKMYKTNDDESKFILSKELDFCEGCGEWKHVIIREREVSLLQKFLSAFRFK